VAPGTHRWLLDAILASVVVLLVAGPMLFTKSGFAVDFTNHLWLTWVAGSELARAARPDYFLNVTGTATFYPFFAFYGGTLYNVTGAISDLLGGRAAVAFIGVTVLAIAGCYGGMLWLGRQLGLRDWTAHAPALVVVSSAYYITNLYGRGAWTEFMATSAIAPALASGVHLVRARSWRPAPVLLFVVSVAIFTGSHNITLLWGTTMLLVAALVTWLTMGAPRTLPRRVAMVLGLGALGTLLNAWFLVPDLTYARDTLIGGAPTAVAATFFDTPAVVLDPLRYVPPQSSTPALYVQAPVWFLAWGVAAGALLLLRRPRPDRLLRAWLAAMAVVAIALGLAVVGPIWTVMPFPLSEIQFPYRIGTYVFYATAGLVLVGALALQRSSGTRTGVVRGVRVTLVAAALASAGLGIWQLWVPNTLMHGDGYSSYTKRSAALAGVNVLPHSWYDPGSYGDAQAPVVAVPGGRSLTIPAKLVSDDRFSAWLKVPPGFEPIQTNIDGGPYLVHISGLTRIGRNAQGFTVVRRVPGDRSGPVHVVMEATHSATLELGWALSVFAILAILAILGYVTAREFAGRRSPSARERDFPLRSSAGR
jgi:hypothetical protein